MRSLRHLPHSRWFARVSPGLVALGAAGPATAAVVLPLQEATARRDDAYPTFNFAYDGVLGTSLDAQFDTTSARDAREGERRVLAEIDRLEKILSPRDPASEFRRVRAGAVVESPELAAVLAAYDLWSARTQGALHVNLAEVTALWQEAARTGRAPTADALAAAFATPRAFAIDALGKAFIIDRAVAIAREFSAGGLLNVGGDLRAWGDRAWMIAVANPFDPADNAAPLAQFPLRNAAVATSGGYARNFSVGAQRYSHLIDPRTLLPLEAGRAATAVAADCLSANALATALCVLDDNEGASVGRAFAMDFLRVDATGSTRASGGFGAMAPAIRPNFADSAAPLASAAVTATAPTAGAPWPADFQIAINLELIAAPEGRRVKRPYVAVWIEDSANRLVRTVTVWGNEGRYLPELTNWWHVIGGSRKTAAAVTRATRYPGAYMVTWDGRDDQGRAVPQGDYTVRIEINREHGHHVWESTTVKCGAETATAEIHDTAESDVSPITYGPRKG